MKNILLLLFVCLLPAVSAQQTEYKGTPRITPVQLEQIGDSLYVVVDFDLSDVVVKSLRSISLIPVLTAPDREAMLPEIVVKGRENFLTSQREVALMSRSQYNTYQQTAPYAILKGYRAGGSKQITYRQTLYFESWMNEARLDIREESCGCGRPVKSLVVSQLVNRVQTEPLIEPYQVMPRLTYVQPVAELIKKREMVGEAFLDFIVNKIDIRPDYMNNPRELKKITDMMSEIKADNAITVKQIEVEGYASPEGSLARNQRLSEGRAGALVEYLSSHTHYPRQLYSATFGGENWQGLLTLVEASQMNHKEEVLALLRSTAIDNETRKTRLKQLRNGHPYRYMLNEYYASLRKAICRIEYEVKGFEVDEAREMVKLRPQNLSLNEMYLVANSYPSGSEEFIDLFDTAVRMFPHDPVANLNAATAALSRGDLVTAQRYLAKADPSTPEYQNTQGVLMLLEQNYPAAREHLSQAAAQGLSHARENLEELRRKLENIEQLQQQQQKKQSLRR